MTSLPEQLIKLAFFEKSTETLTPLVSNDVILKVNNSTQSGVNALISFITNWIDGFSNLKFEKKDYFTNSKNQTSITWTISGKHTGLFDLHLPTQCEIKIDGAFIIECKNDKIQSFQAYYDTQALYEQLNPYPKKDYSTDDFIEDFTGPAKKVFEWIFYSRKSPACKQAVADTLRYQFACIPPPNKPQVIVPEELMTEVETEEIYIPAKKS